ncbi:uncharacterized protein LOC133783657 [Humulus lupulus]|uniref:uncharacterized protein LOC133783657 n=1 Tax=Humulus lupulus TaxID=3486 RepID=UPI002B40360B|nr:uncharacterized protein LOC133783657 [Humulus lupulus]
MEIRVASLASMKDIEKSAKELVTEANLRLVGLLAPHQDVRETTAGNSTAMSSEDLFKLYNVPTVPSSKKKESRRHCGESSKAPPTKNARTRDPPAAVPSRETTPPPAPLDQTSPLAPTDQTSPPAPDQTPPQAPTSQMPPAQTLTSIVLSSAKERLTKLPRHRRSQEAITGTDSMEVDHIINRTLNEIASGMLTMTARWRRSGALITQLQTSEAKHAEELKADEAKHTEQLEATKDRHTEQLKAVEKTNAELLDQKNKLAEELKQFQAALTKAIDEKEKFKESSKLNFHEAKQLEAELVASRKDTEELEGRIKELEETNASNWRGTRVPPSTAFTSFGSTIARLISTIFLST